MPRFCSHCGAEMVDAAAFCPKCGRATGSASSISGESQASTATSTVLRAVPGAVNHNVAGLLCYFFIPAIAFLFVRPYCRDRFVRFHSFQAIFLWVLFIVVNSVVVAFPLITLLILPVLLLAETILVLMCMIKAWQRYMFKLPVLGDFSERQAGA